MPHFSREDAIQDPGAFLNDLGLTTEGPEHEHARQVIQSHAQVMNRVWTEEMRRRGDAPFECLNTPENQGGSGPATDNETARPSPPVVYRALIRALKR